MSRHVRSRSLRLACAAVLNLLVAAPTTMMIVDRAWADETRPEDPAPLAPPVEPTGPLPFTFDVVGSHGWLTGGQPDAHAVDARGTWDITGGDVLRGEVLDETKFRSHGGIVAASYTHVIGPDWIVAGSMAFGHGGLNWANTRGDVEVTTKWFESRNMLTRIAVYRADYDGRRSDTGTRVSLVGYTRGDVVLEGGGLYNVSQPSSVSSAQGFASVTWGKVGHQYLSARYSAGTEAYQAVGNGRQLVGFHSKSVGVNWRVWIDRAWGFTLAGEHYSNPSYQRNSLGLGAFVQW